MENFYLGLVHYPIVNKNKELVTTSVTNLDIHDIARSCKTFGVSNYFLITPLEKQHQLLNRLLGHWKEDSANAYNPDRQDALSIVRVVNSIEDACTYIKKKDGVKPSTCVTGANLKDVNLLSSEEYRLQLKIDNSPNLLLFGTGWGLTPECCKLSDFRLQPIFGPKRYNHLSVRSAVAIYLSRLFSERL